VFKKTKVINYLELTPIRNREFVEEEGKITILIPKFKNNYLKSLIPKKKSPNFHINFDELGSATWKKIDGEKKVEVIANELAEIFGDKIAPAEERVTKFLSQLYQHKFIKFKELMGK
jgi:hypothetical protein